MESKISQNEYTLRINKTLDFINSNLSEEINLEVLANIACFSPFHFHRIFTGLVGETPRDYIERLRLELAANSIFKYPNKTITEIAFESGFPTLSSFSRAFKRHFKVSAVHFLKKHIEDFHSIETPTVLHNFRKDYNPDKISVQNLPETRIVFARTLEAYRTGIPKAWQKIFNYAKVHDLLNENITCVGIPWDNPGITPRGRCRYFAGISIPEKFAPKGEIGVMILPKGKYGVYDFEGTREDIAKAYAELYGIWLPNSGYIPQETPSFEIYPHEMLMNLDIVLKYKIALPIKSF